MITATNILYLYTETPLHVGTGSGLSSVDLPIQRERTTQYPMIQGSGIKGKLRAAAQAEKLVSHEEEIIFGTSGQYQKNGTSNDEQPKEHAGSLIVGDARILLFPVRSLNGIFAYTTSHDVLQRFARDLERSQGLSPWKIPAVKQDDEDIPTAFVTPSSKVIIPSNGPSSKTASIILEEFNFNAKPDPTTQEIAQWLAENALPQYGNGPESAYWQDKLIKSLVILPDNDFRDFVLYATEVITRIQIEQESKTVKDGALWTEEHLPTDTLLYVPVYATNSRRQGSERQGIETLTSVSLLGRKTGTYLQIGGNETVGRGMVRTRWGQPRAL